MSDSKTIVATLCYIEKDGQVLMLKRNKRPEDLHYGKWNGLGGKALPQESPDECVIREVKEESNLVIKDPLLKGIISFPLFDAANDYLVFIYTADKFSGTKEENEEGELHWVKKGEIPKLNLWEGDRVFLPWLEENSFFLGKFIYKDGAFVEHSVRFH